VRGTVFYKMSGSGNDFVVLDGRTTSLDRWPADRIRVICDRRTGVGADGLVILTPQSADTVRMVYWNSDGSRAEMCGNAALCSGRLAADLELAAAGSLSLLTDAGAVQVRAQAGGDRAEVRLPDAELPQSVQGLEPVPGERWLAFGSVGVPHLVVRVDDVAAADLSGRGRELRSSSRLGPAGANVNFVSPPVGADAAWSIRTYERGVEAETLACGTGAVATGLALAAAGETDFPVRLRSRSGLVLTVDAHLEGGRATEIWLGGQSRLVFRGVWEG
jgi:diaminopimelate epimerase